MPRGDPARYNLQPIPQCITCTPSPRTHSSETSEVNPVGTCGVCIAPMIRRGYTRWPVRVRPRTQTRLYLAYRGCGRLQHRNRWSHSNRSQCECKGNRSSEWLIKASHCRSKSSKCRSFGGCSSNRTRGSLCGHRRNICSNSQQWHHHRQRRYHHSLRCGDR